MRALRMWKASDELNAELMLDLLPEPDRGLLPPLPFPSEGRDLPDDLLHDRSTHALTTDPPTLAPLAAPTTGVETSTSPMNPYPQCRHDQRRSCPCQLDPHPYLLRGWRGNQAVAAVLGDKVHSTPLAGLATSLVALLGFVTFYALERATTDRSAAQPSRPGRCSWFSLPSSPRTADW